MENISNENDIIDNKFREYLLNVGQLPFGVAIAKNDNYSTIIRANSAFYQIIGYTKADFMEHHQNRLMNVLIDTFYDAIEKQPTNKDTDFEWNLRLRTADGEIRWIHDFAHYDADLDVFFLLFTDITDKLLSSGKNLSYNAFHTKHAILSYLSKHTSELIIVSDAITDEVVYINHLAMEKLGFKSEKDWLGKSYIEVGFGSHKNIPSSYFNIAKEGDFTEREYFNNLHKIYVHVKSKIITIPALNRKMRLNIITNITAQKQLEHKMLMQKTLHNCIESLFTTTTTNAVAESAYYDILGQLKDYYQADGAFFYKLTDSSNHIEAVYKVLADDVRIAKLNLPLNIFDEQIELMHALAAANSSQQQKVLEDYADVFAISAKQLRLGYNIDNLACAVVNNAEGEIVAFLGVTNPKTNEDNKDLMELLSRFICMFIEHQQDQDLKEESLTLEAISKANIIEKCNKNFQNLSSAKESVSDTLDALCDHYDADFAMVLSENGENSYSISHIGGRTIPNLDGLQNQPASVMKKWEETFKEHSQFVTDAELDAPVAKKLLKENYGIYNFISSPIQEANGNLVGLLFVCNYKLFNRDQLLVHVIAKNISDYLDKIGMHEKANLEPLTKLFNKTETENQITRLLGNGEKGALFALDIDNFKSVNDTLGHQTGDQAIVDVAEILKQIFRTTDIIGRVGGDEFMVFAPGLTSNELITVKAMQMLHKCNLFYKKDDLSTEISLSIGICSVSDKNNSFESLYEKADKALYISKNNGKNRYHIYTTAEQK